MGTPLTKVTEVLAVLYLRGMSTKDFEPGLAAFFGTEAGLSPSTIQRLTREVDFSPPAAHEQVVQIVNRKRAASLRESHSSAN